MSRQVSPSANRPYGVLRVTRAWGHPEPLLEFPRTYNQPPGSSSATVIEHPPSPRRPARLSRGRMMQARCLISVDRYTEPLVLELKRIRISRQTSFGGKNQDIDSASPELNVESDVCRGDEHEIVQDRRIVEDASNQVIISDAQR